MSVGTNIKGLREDRGLTQEQIADALGISFQAVSSWERDEYKPDTDKVIRLAELFDVSVSAILEEKHKAFKTKEAIYNWEHMKTYVKTTAKNFKMDNTAVAVDFAVNAHEGQKRKRSVIPYIYHPLNLACHALSMDIREDDVIAACMLHDVVEDCGVKLEELPVDDETKEIVRLVTRRKCSDEERDAVNIAYYNEIEKNPKACLVKCLDRCNNLTTMSFGLSRDRIYRMIKETEEYYPRLIAVLKATPRYNSAAWLLRYQMESMLDIYKRLM
ncbi:helix-turn-helix domain-containing protein [Butyrivibrio sp. CB08]|uniref:helix-turn-helix domain-containing protein n=1 Tax=Butyrivibrio sp. CB08 TaxID=2364879 RepID=UPI000EA946CB|nr:helix-turn-helix transcriptional regulator [Butyrivibrio sp. CB08]RKM62313.1 helix-turn-helix domain-containing protein [Butyrivibrio sp. CB08]